MNGAICGGVVSKTLFESDPDRYLMAYVMPDEQFEKYKEACENENHKLRKMLFKKYAISMI